MGSVTSAVPTVINTIANTGQKSLNIPQSLLNETTQSLNGLQTLALNGISKTNILLSQLQKSNKWVNLDLSYQIVSSGDELSAKLNEIKTEYQNFKDEMNKIISKSHDPSVENIILSGMAGPFGAAVLLLQNELMKVFDQSMVDFAGQLDSLDTSLFMVNKFVKEAKAQGKSVISQAQFNAWDRFIPQMTSIANNMNNVLNQLLQNINKVKQQLNEMEMHDRPPMMAVPAPIWGGRKTMNTTSNLSDDHKESNDAFINIKIKDLPNYKASTHLPSTDDEKTITDTPVPPPPPMSHVPGPLLVDNASASDTKEDDKKKLTKITATALKKVVANNTQHSINTMKKDPTKFHHLDNAVQQIKPDSGSKTWTQFATAAADINSWAKQFTKAVSNATIDAAIASDTRMEIWDVLQSYKSQLQSTSLSLQQNRHHVQDIQNALNDIKELVIPPDDILASWKSMKKTDPNLQSEVTKAATGENLPIFQERLKKLSKLLNDHADRDKLLSLSKEWGKNGILKRITKIENDVKHDVNEYKKHMKLFAWITAAITMVLGICAVLTSFGAAAPAVTAEVADEAVEMAVMDDISLAVDNGVDDAAADVIAPEVSEESISEEVSEVSEEAPEAVENTTSKASTICKNLAKFGLISVVIVGSTGFGALLKYIGDENAKKMLVINDGLSKLSEDAELASTLLFEIYKSYLDLDEDDIFTMKDQKAESDEFKKGWGRIDAQKLVTHLKNSWNEAQDTINNIKGAESSFDTMITNYTNDIYTPLQKIFTQ